MKGLELDIKEFNALSNSKQHTVLYQNLLELKTNGESYRFHQKVQYWAIGLLSSGIGSIFWMLLN